MACWRRSEGRRQDSTETWVAWIYEVTSVKTDHSRSFRAMEKHSKRRWCVLGREWGRALLPLERFPSPTPSLFKLPIVLPKGWGRGADEREGRDARLFVFLCMHMQRFLLLAQARVAASILCQPKFGAYPEDGSSKQAGDQSGPRLAKMVIVSNSDRSLRTEES